jgi:predicted restriction endonuclease
MTQSKLILIKEQIKNIKEESEMYPTYIKLKNNNPDLINSINLFFIKFRGNIPEMTEIKETKEERLKRKDKEFRDKVIKKYNSKCAITGIDYNLGICEVAHIYPFSSSSEEEKYDLNNGILLCGYLHKWFDSGRMKINPETKCIEFTDKIMSNETVKEYHKFNNKKIQLNSENIKYLKKIYTK